MGRKLIINFYKRSNSKKIFEGQLILAYQSRLGNAGNSSEAEMLQAGLKKCFFIKNSRELVDLRDDAKKFIFVFCSKKYWRKD